MATSVKLIRRYIWLVETIRSAGRITLEEINAKWQKSSLNEDNESLPDRTFHRHREAIASIFGIEILCDRYEGNVYYIDNENDLNQPSAISLLLDSLSITNQLIDNKEVMERIQFEEVANGGIYIPVLIKALSNKQIVSLEYSNYNNPELKKFAVEPYGLKQAGRRWYLISHIPGYETLTVFALDRIKSILLTEDKFEYDKNWNVNAYFKEVIGVNLEEDYDCEEVKVRIFGHQRHYIESLPLHKSQKLLKRGKEYSEYSFRLRPEYEFQHEILKLGCVAEVLSPQWLRNEIKRQAEEILNLYQPK